MQHKENADRQENRGIIARNAKVTVYQNYVTKSGLHNEKPDSNRLKYGSVNLQCL